MITRSDLTLSEYTSLKSLIEKEIIIFDELFEDMTTRSYREELESEFDERPVLIDELSKQLTLIQGLKSITSDAERYDWSNIFDKPNAQLINQKVDKEKLKEIYDKVSKELDANPDLVRTMSVKPPRGSGKIRMISIGESIDYQPCGGTHVNKTSEISIVNSIKIENKGKMNKRIIINLSN